MILAGNVPPTKLNIFFAIGPWNFKKDSAARKSFYQGNFSAFFCPKQNEYYVT